MISLEERMKTRQKSVCFEELTNLLVLRHFNGVNF